MEGLHPERQTVLRGDQSKIFDFVKDHVSAKVDRYASLGKKLEQHGNILTEREEMLSAARTRMVEESESVLGTSLSM
ncbi:hypothetical protein APHAL10511_005018 [Amanita phalloides]|nr:hypothetical protein APHAL10511_005018 [Amanita phalloides]